MGIPGWRNELLKENERKQDAKTKTPEGFKDRKEKINSD
jgi:hypothetical protein